MHPEHHLRSSRRLPELPKDLAVLGWLNSNETVRKFTTERAQNTRTVTVSLLE